VDQVMNNNLFGSIITYGGEERRIEGNGGEL
jgi:hypothetical protein